MPTDIEFLSQVIDSESFTVGRADTTYLDGFQPSAPDGEDPLNQEVALVAALLAHSEQNRSSTVQQKQPGGPPGQHVADGCLARADAGW